MFDRMMVVVLTSFLTAALLTHGVVASVAHAAPEQQPDDDADQPQDARDLIAAGFVQFELADYDAALELWEQAYAQLPVSTRGQLAVPLANAHVRAYEGDSDPEHLLKAKALFNDHLETLDTDDEELRATIEIELAKIDTELARLDAELAKRDVERAEIEKDIADARVEASEASEAGGQAGPSDSGSERRFRVQVGVGTSLAGLGVVSSTAMAAGLALGDGADRNAPSDPNLAPYGSEEWQELQDLRKKGEAYNRMAWTTGVIGGALLISGVTTIIVAVAQHKRDRGSTATRLRPWASGLELRF
jgi:tetratricopeptide (TPR) repeat protein